eukprot:CAMPEP_0118973932 /NCGR_PEP_ID=MMETSP1173-20130426/10985_1 /TAXON_ID=1034831 /ORGANISM="Rhizochromulina marina cf, Strain CCMP1243" /LENGTH=36 /DNA_ID= /DNA_START= /DNA_END= /DNA_ORIENTATION=
MSGPQGWAKSQDSLLDSSVASTTEDSSEAAGGHGKA